MLYRSIRLTIKVELYRGILELTLPNRSQLYSRPGLSDVNGHGGDTINRKLQQALRELGKAMNVQNSMAVFNEELGMCSKRGGGKTTPKKSPTTKIGSGVVAAASAKKRKMEHKEDHKASAEDEEDQEVFWRS